MSIELDVQKSDEVLSLIPSEQQFSDWILAALLASGAKTDVEISVRVVELAESQALNAEYRGKDKPTNVLSFPADIPDFVDSNLLGDIVFCAPVVDSEAKQQNKPEMHHWAHLTVHGCLHLLGFDHVESEEASAMEALEINALSSLGIKDPYVE